MEVEKLAKPRLKFTIITLFIDAAKSYLDSSMMWKAQEKGIVEVEYVNLREFGLGPHRSVDDTPYGGGDGMLLRCEPVFAAVEWVWAREAERRGEGGLTGVANDGENWPRAEVILPTPGGRVWTQEVAREMAGVDKVPGTEDTGVDKTSGVGDFGVDKGLESEGAGVDKMSETASARVDNFKHYIIICPHYEGYDERIMTLVDHPISLGRYVLTGGELPALVMIDSMVRLLPGVLGGEKSAEIESFSDGDNVEYPQYTKPAEFRGMKVPEVLLSGHHGRVEEWRRGREGRFGDKG